MRTSFNALLFLLAAIATTAPAPSQPPAAGPAPAVQYLDQGWDDATRQAFYSTSQGSRMMPYVWFKALRRLDVDAPFGGDQLQRYGYIANEKSTDGLPIGFVIDVASADLGMTCAACHTAQIEYQKDGATQLLRIDGAPATADFQLFLTELAATLRATVSDANRFDRFAHDVLGPQYSVASAITLKSKFGDWVNAFAGFMDDSLPASSPWGPARLDAFGMIFNRVAGKDLGIPDNIKVADAPVSYPFLWNASRQDKTQWNGGVPNGLYINAIGRNTGEVFGVFADFSPTALPSIPGLPPIIDYAGKNSVNFRNLQFLEEKIASLESPKWPFALDPVLVEKGKGLFESNCKSCHGRTDSREVPGAWATPVVAADTDPRMFDHATNRMSHPGILKGTLVPNLPVQVLDDPAKTSDVLATAVVGTLVNEVFPIPNPTSGVWLAVQKDMPVLFPPLKDAPVPLLVANPAVLGALRTKIENRLTNMFKPPAPDAPAAYESRVLYGIWATAPYLHNGSVPNLWQLLLPPERRSPSFMVGSRKYDEKNVGYVTTETPYKDGTLVVGAGAAPGNSNAGHDYTQGLTDDDRRALLEYLKTL